jgi:hypothetical protein
MMYVANNRSPLKYVHDKHTRHIVEKKIQKNLIYNIAKG